MKKRSKYLIIDTATSYLYVALYEGFEPIDIVYQQGKNNHSVTLMPTIETLFDHTKMSLEDIDEIVVGVGPGSYTGVRIGVVVAKMFAWSLNKPLWTISSLALLASAAKGPKILAYQDARRGNAFLGLYEYRDKQLKRLQEDQHTALDAFISNHAIDETISEGKPDFSLLLASDLLIRASSVHHVSPLYLRKTEAERNLNNG